MVGSPFRTVTMPSSRNSVPAAMPGMRRRPSQMTRRRPVEPFPAGLALAGELSRSTTTAVKAATWLAGA